MNICDGKNFRYARSMLERVLSFLCVFTILFSIVCVDIPVRKAYALEAVCICGLPEHTHNEACTAAQLVCDQVEHTHDEKCFRIEELEENAVMSMMLTNQEEGSGAQDNSCENKPMPEPTANLIPESAVQHTPDDTAQTAPERVDDPTIQPTDESIPEPTEVSTPELTEEPPPTLDTEPVIATQLSISDLKTVKDVVKVNESIEWTFACNGAESVRYQITDAKDNVVSSGELGKARSVAWTPKRSGAYSIRIVAVRDDETLSLSSSVIATADELKAQISTSIRSGFANEDTLRFECTVEGGVVPYEVSYTVYRDGSIEEDTTNGFQEFLSFIPRHFGIYTVVMRVVDAEGNESTAKCTIPVAIREKENERIWLESMKDVQLTGDWGQDIVAIAITQLGYRESERNFIISGEGEMQGYTRYGDLRGMDYEGWCAMFVSFCADYAEIPQPDLPRKSNCARLKKALGSLYIDDEDAYCPEVGDYVFFHHAWEEGKSESKAERNKPNHIGIVVEVDEEQGIIYTIEGNSAKSVRRRDYQLSDKQIVGYMSMRKAMERAGVLPVDTQHEPSTQERDWASTNAEDGFAEEQELADGIVRIIANGVRLRSIASTEGDVLGHAYIGDEYVWLETVENGSEIWYAIKLGNESAYVRSDLAQLIMEEVSDVEESVMTDETSEEPAQAEQSVDEVFVEGDTIEDEVIDNETGEDLLQQSWDSNGIESLCTEHPGRITVTRLANWHIATVATPIAGSAFAPRDKEPYTIILANLKTTDATIKKISATVGDNPVTVVVPRHDDEMVNPYTLAAATVSEGVTQRGNGSIPVRILQYETDLTGGRLIK